MKWREWQHIVVNVRPWSNNLVFTHYVASGFIRAQRLGYIRHKTSHVVLIPGFIRAHPGYVIIKH